MAPKKLKRTNKRKLSPATREAVAAAASSGEKSRGQVAKQFGISSSTVASALRKAKRGQFTDLPRSGRPKKLTSEDEQRLKELADASEERSIRKLKNALAAGGGPNVSNTTVGRILHDAGFLPLQPEQVQLKPGLSKTFEKLSDSLNRFEDTKRFADSFRNILGAMPLDPGEPERRPKSEELSDVFHQTAEKYGPETQVGKTLQNASETLAKLSNEERVYEDYVKRHCVVQLATIDQDSQVMANASDEKDLKTVTEEMFVAKRRLRNAKKNRDSYREKAKIAKTAFELQKEAIECVAPNISQHRDKQREVVKTFIEAQRVFYLRAASVIEKALPYL